MKTYRLICLFIFSFSILISCDDKTKQGGEIHVVSEDEKNHLPVILDTDANNEIDDQHAMAYLFFNDDVFDVKGITVNATFGGGDIDGHMAEAKRVMDLCDVTSEIPLLKGANDNFDQIRSKLKESDYDGYAAVDFIIESARKMKDKKLTLIPIGKLTNIALALEKAPDIIDKIKIVWLGSNYPEKGEYNQDNDPSSLRYILELDVPFEMVTVRYGKPSGSDAVRATPENIKNNMAGAGPKVDPVEGRHGSTFTNFGDYAFELFSKIELDGTPPSRALFDVVAVAILKNPNWGEKDEIPAPILNGDTWQERPDNKRKITIWENFNSKSILNDFYTIMRSS